jgi:periplasmic copper chaperone A
MFGRAHSELPISGPISVQHHQKVIMKRKTIMSMSALGAGVALAIAVPLSASAHVGVSASSTAAGSYTVLTFSVPHGCDGSPTEKIAIGVPESIVEATATVNPNWTISEVTEPLSEPLTAEDGDPITDRVSQIVYTAKGAPLPADQRDTFQLALVLPAGSVGDVVEFPVEQTCTDSTVTWDGEEVPAVTLTAAAESTGHDHGDPAPADAPASDDVLARVLGIGGLVVGAIGIVLAATSRRTAAK